LWWWYALTGGTTQGQGWMQNAISNSKLLDVASGNVKASVPWIVCTVPLWLALTIASLSYPSSLTQQSPLKGPGSVMTKKAAPIMTSDEHDSKMRATQHTSLFYIGSVIAYCIGCGNSTGDPDMTRFAIIGLLVPTLIYTGASMIRKLSSSDGESFNTDFVLKEIANVSAMGVLVASASMGFLIPAALQSPGMSILWSRGISRAQALILHMWVGRIVVLGSSVHGLLHMVRWQLESYVVDNDTGAAYQDSLFRMIIPPTDCWSLPWIFRIGSNSNSDSSSSKTSHCTNPDLECTCYHIVRNLTGFLAVLALWAIALTSLAWVRRRWYQVVFRRVHMLAVPISVFGIVYHYNRALLYMAGSLVGYLAATWPVRIESWKRHYYLDRRYGNHTRGGSGGVHITNAQLIGSSFVSLTVAATKESVKQYQPGQYVHLSILPSTSASQWDSIRRLLSTVWGMGHAGSKYDHHPFSINKVVRTSSESSLPSADGNSQLRIIFAIRGNWTQQLAARLDSTVNKVHSSGPRSLMDAPVELSLSGFYGTTNRVEQLLAHDKVVIVAGGIGITPYLTLLHEICRHQRSQINDLSSLQSINHYESTKEIHMHWICRDDALIEYVHREYFDSLSSLLSQQGASTAQDKASSDRNKVSLRITIHRTGRITRQATLSGDLVSRVDQTGFNGLDEEKNQELTTKEVAAASSSSSSERYILSADSDDGPNSPGQPFQTSQFSSGICKSNRSTLNPSFVAHALIGGGGLPAVWYSFSQVQSKDKVASRGWVLIFLLVWAMIVSVLVNYLPTSNSDRYDRDSCPWSPLDHKDSEHEEVEMQDIDAAGKHAGEEGSMSERAESIEVSRFMDETASKERGDACSSIFSMDESQGRPDVATILSPLWQDYSSSPGLFACGPGPLMVDIQQALNRRQRSARCAGHGVAFYSESFDM
jgi:ferredoxin-NADP reductase